MLPPVKTSLQQVYRHQVAALKNLGHLEVHNYKRVRMAERIAGKAVYWRGTLNLHNETHGRRPTSAALGLSGDVEPTNPTFDAKIESNTGRGLVEAMCHLVEKL